MSDHENTPSDNPEDYPDTTVPLSWAISEVLDTIKEQGWLPQPDVERAREVAMRDSDSEVTSMEERLQELQEMLDENPDNDDGWRELEQLQRDYAQALIHRSNIPPA